VKLFTFSLLVFFSSVLFAQTKTLLSVEELFKADQEKVLSTIEKLSKEESQELVTKVRQEARKDFAEIDRFYFLISHLEEISAIEKEQARLRSVLWVFGLGFLLFSGFVLLLVIRINKLSDEVKQLIAGE
jgi:hypothetical protein